MWLERIKEVTDKQKRGGEFQHLNFRFELHLCIYMIELVKGIIDFQLKNDKLIIKLIKTNKILKPDEFIYWWQITRHNDIFNEEVKLVSKITSIQDKMKLILEAISNISKLKQNDTNNMKDINNLQEEYNKLETLYQAESPIIKDDIKLLEGLRNSFSNREIIDLTLGSMEIYLKYK